MNGVLADTLALKPHRHVPFIPAVYEQKGFLIGRTPSEVSRDPNLLAEALVAEYDLYRADALTVGVDVYNIEAEAAGATVLFPEGIAEIPAITKGLEVASGENFAHFRVPDPARDGRMPFMIEVAERTIKRLGNHVPVRAALSGPFSMAAGLMGAEGLLTSLLDDRERVVEILRACAETIFRYGREFVRRGCGVVMFDSQASPQVISPALYRQMVLPATQFVIHSLQSAGAEHVPLIIGGDTTPIIDAYLVTGGNNILCDAPASIDIFLEKCSAAKRAFRKSIDSTNFLTISRDEISAAATGVLQHAGGYRGFILGTGVVPYGTPSEIITAIRQATLDFSLQHTS
jgi:uroporphyrinogen decarboxylase